MHRPAISALLALALGLLGFSPTWGAQAGRDFTGTLSTELSARPAVVAAAPTVNDDGLLVQLDERFEPNRPKPGILQRAGASLKKTYNEGTWELYVPLHTHHMRFAYDKEAWDGFNEFPLGLGVGKGRFTEDGDYHGLYALYFGDSHGRPEYHLGYAYKTYWSLYGDLKFGLGYTAFLGFRKDFMHYKAPFPGVLPLGAIEYKNLSFDAVYVPGGKGYGNVIFMWSKIRF